MTVMQSLLSTFRQSRSRTRKSLRGRHEPVSSGESLESRLLLTNPVILDSLPGAPVTIYLDFDGHTESDPSWLTRRELEGDGTNAEFTVDAFDRDGDTSSFSAAEITDIEEIFYRIAEDFRPFNVNISTAAPPAMLSDGVSLMATFGSEGTWTGSSTSIGSAPSVLSSFSDSEFPNNGFVFTDGDSYSEAGRASAMIAIQLGVLNHSDWNPDGSLLNEFAAGTPEVGPISGSGNYLRNVWDLSPNSVSAVTIQDDLATITDAGTNGITYRADDHGNTTATATNVSLTPGIETLSGIIETNSDTDLFRIQTLGTTATVSISGLDLTTDFPGTTNPGSNLDPVLTLLDSNGSVIATDDPAYDAGTPNASLKASLTETVATGTYYLQVSNRGEYGNLGEYTLTIEGVDGPPVVISATSESAAENGGTLTAAGRVSRPDNQPAGTEIEVTLTSSDTSELTVPSSVIIPANQDFATFDITVHNDDLLDGTQNVTIQALVGGVFNSEILFRVQDFETIDVSLAANPIAENAGTATLTVSRSNTDVDEPNHWVAVNNTLEERRPDGTLNQTIAIEWPGGGTRPAGEDAHDVLVLENGNIAVYNGTANANLSVYSLVGNSWQHFTGITGLSADATDATAGGIASIGDYVFLTDLESVADDPHGMTRINTITGEVVRFGENSIGSRLFGMPFQSGTTINEYNPSTGELLNSFQIQSNGGFSNFAIDIAYDGENLWALVNAGSSGAEEILKLDPDSGAILETHSLAILQNTVLDGLASMNGLLYVVDNIGNFGGFFGFGTEIEGYDPSTRQVVGGLLSIDNINGISFNDYIATIPTANVLIATDSSSNRIYELDPITGLTTTSFLTNRTYPSGFHGPGLTSISDVVIGNTTYDELIYVAAGTNGTEFDIYTRLGVQVDADPSTLAIDPLHFTVPAFGALSGADIPGISAADLRFRDVTIGFDGLVYGLLDNGTEISVHDPNSLLRLDSIVLDTAVRTIAVTDGAGIYGGGSGGQVTYFDTSGNTVSTLSTGLVTISDIEINIAQKVLISDVAGAVASASQNDIETGNTGNLTILENVGNNAFVSFGRHNTQPSGDIVVSLRSDDTSEIQVQESIVIPAGQTSVDVQITIVDDNERDGAQTLTVSGTATDYISNALDVTVSDHETITVEVIPTEVSENAGTVVDAVRITRSDTDGPYTRISSQSRSMTETVAIIDSDVTLAHVDFESQVSQITDLNVTLSIEHDAIPDLDVFLISPNGTRVELFTDLSSNASNLTDTTLDDEAATRIVDGSAPYTGLFSPEQLLSTFDGENPSGTWSLELIDDNNGDIGNLISWTLDITTIGLEPVEVTLSSSDDSEAQVATTVTIPENQVSVLVPLNAVPDDILDGTQNVTISATNSNATGFILIPDTLDVTDGENLIFTVDLTTVAENAGDGAIRGTVTRTDSSTGAVVLSLTSSDTSELTVPATVTIPAGEPSVSFDIDAVDDFDFDGTQIVTITASATGYISANSEELSVTDQEPRLSLSTLTPTIAEDEGTITLTIARLDANDLGVPQEINLTSSDSSELTVPATVTIPAGEISIPFTATIHSDTVLDGSQVATITAVDSNTASPGINGTSIDITIDDAETLTITVPAGNETFSENAGSEAVTATVSISTADHSSPLFITLTRSDSSEISIPQTVIIPVGATSATFAVDAIDDPVIDGSQAVTVTASLQGYRSGTIDLSVTDHEPPLPVGPESNTEDPTPTLSWSGVDGASRYDLWVNDVSRNITQLFRLENLPASSPLFEDDFESGTFDSALWAANSGVEIDSDALNDPNGNLSARFNGSEEGLDRLESVTLDLSGRIGVQLSYTFEQTGQGDSPADGHDLVLSYRTEAGIWQQLHRQPGSDPDMDRFQTIVLNLPEEALHSNFALRIESEGPTTQADENNPVYADWFVDSVKLTEHSQFTPVQELGVGRYRYWVRAFDSLEQPMAWSRGKDFLIRTRPEIVSPVSTSSVAFNSFPEISWTSVVDTANYDLWVNNVTTGESQVIRQTDLQSTSYASENAGLSGGAYRAWVRAMGPDGTPGYWSGSTTFSVLTAPENVQPSGETFDRTPEITWNAVAGATNYHVWLNRTDPGQTPVIVLRDAVVTGTSRIPDGDLENGNYTVWVQAIGADQTKSSWSTATQFTIGGRPVLTATGTQSEPSFQWTGISGTEVYEFWVDRIDQPQIQIVYDANVTATSYNISTALGAGEYRVWVRAVSDMGEVSLWSKPVDFTVASIDTDTDTDLIAVTPVLASLPLEANSTATTRSWDQIVNNTSESAAGTIIAVASAPKLTEQPTASETPATESTESVDAVMAELAAADWWVTDKETETEQEVPSSAAFGLGLISTGALRRRKNRREKE